MVLLGAVVARLIIPTGFAAIAIYAQNNHIGVWNNISVTLLLSVPISVLLFDCLIYWQHRVFHRVPEIGRDIKYTMQTPISTHQQGYVFTRSKSP
ncbi:MAG: sterol desaturase/sphingolipid hydroxylase (fatty acid hydroxylase superfamily) [Glaciecola sp.]|jgi:sterol desaturase/sphingolipid hydroxylase (fatty acid hydroxylase superfamily)